MNGEILSIDTVNKMSDDEKKIERLNRDKNLLELKNNSLESNLSKAKKRINQLEKKEQILRLVENTLEDRIKFLISKNENSISAGELQRLLTTIKKAYVYDEEKEENEED